MEQLLNPLHDPRLELNWYQTINLMSSNCYKIISDKFSFVSLCKDSNGFVPYTLYNFI